MTDALTADVDPFEAACLGRVANRIVYDFTSKPHITTCASGHRVGG